MALPKITSITYKINLPVSKEDIEFRPYLVKEQKILLQAAEMGTEEQLLRSIDQILKNVTNDKVDLDIKYNADIEYLMLNVRGKSVGEIIDLGFTCPNIVKKIQYDKSKDLPTPLKDEDGNEIYKDEKCNTKVESQVNINDVKVTITENRNNKIQLTDTVGIILKDLTYGENKNIKFNDAETEVERLNNNLKLLIKHIEKVYDDEQVYTDFTEKEMLEFIEQLSTEDIEKIQEYIETSPRLEHKIELVCPKCGFTTTQQLVGLSDFL